MSAQVKLSAAMPGDFETNGVDALAGQLVDAPEELRVAVIWFDTKKVEIDTDTGDHLPTIRVRRIEPLGNADAVTKEIRTAVEKAHETRTGRKPLPFDVVEIVRDGSTDPFGGDDE